MEKALSAPRGVRFAPSPTGRFHVGNLRTAWISREFAREWREPWVVRFEDIDAPRSLEGAREQQLADMAALGLVPDQVLIQSQAHARHWETFGRAIWERRAYPCFCSRKDVRDALEHAGSAPHPAPAAASGGTEPGFPRTYSGHCRGLKEWPPHDEHGLPTVAWRFAVEEDPSGAADFIIGRTSARIDAQGFPLEPASFAPAYHWACSVDDLDGGYRLLVRAADLAEVLPQHRAIMRWLAAAEGRGDRACPAVYHTSLVTQNDGNRLEKRTAGVTLPDLAARGYAVEQVLERFRASWDPAALNAWAPGRVFGEAKARLTLNELGLG